MSLHELEQLLDAHVVKGTSKPDDLPWVVVVDDDAGVRAALTFALKDSYRLRVCPGATEGVAAVDAQVSAVILDIKMHGHDGFWAYKAIREKNEHVPIIFNSAYQDIKNPYDVMNDYRPFGFVTKGGETEVLLKAVAAAVKYSQEWQAHARAMEELRRVKEEMERLRQRR